MYKVINRNGSVFGTEPCLCEFVCDTTDDVSTLPTSITEGTGGKTKYDNQVCGSGSIAVVIDNGINPKRYILDNQDAWCPQSSDGTGSNQDLSEYAKKTEIPTELPANGGNADTVNGHSVNADVPADAVFTDTVPDLSPYALKSKYGDTTINVGRKANTEIGTYSTAEGYGTTASGTNSHAEGAGTTASGRKSHAEGDITTASGYASHAEGDTTTASGYASHAGGTGTKASHDSEVAYGKYNESNDDTLFSVGDGTSETVRHNAFEITKTSGKLHDEEIMTQNKISNPNLLINPDFKINQRNYSGWKVNNNSNGTVDTSTQRYIMDRWRLMDGTITITGGKVWLTGTLIQVLENSIGNNFTASVSIENGTATASYDDSTKTFSIVGDGAALNWAKLEYGTAATPFVPPDPAVELMKCQRYYQVVDLGQPIFVMGNSTSIIRFGVTLPTAIRTMPTVEFAPITGDYTWSITLMKLTESGYIKITDVPTADAVVRLPNYLNIKLTLNTTEIAANLSYMMIGAGGFKLRLDAEIY